MRKPKGLSLKDVKSAISFDQPKLLAEQSNDNIVIKGKFVLVDRNSFPDPAGPLAEYDILLEVTNRFPIDEPKLFEVGGRIPREPERHINTDGSCCVCVWEYWLAREENPSFEAYLNGPVYSFFISQFTYEQTGQWPFGEWRHGVHGLEEAYSEILNIPCDREKVIAYLEVLSMEWPKGHLLCPCGSGKIIRECHSRDLLDLHQRLAPQLAKRMRDRLRALSKPSKVGYRQSRVLRRFP